MDVDASTGRESGECAGGPDLLPDPCGPPRPGSLAEREQRAGIGPGLIGPNSPLGEDVPGGPDRRGGFARPE